MSTKRHPNFLVDRSWLVKARRGKGYTQGQVAAACGLSITAYSNCEAGAQKPNVEAGLLMCDFLGVDVRKFIGEKPIR